MAEVNRTSSMSAVGTTLATWGWHCLPNGAEYSLLGRDSQEDVWGMPLSLIHIIEPRWSMGGPRAR
jgi:hypothetical protein